ncbi:DUF3263 domain-containing protein [Modestobacter sp. VKM Ac-2985]|uniref:DUF3263 domain-containing protein n=1 Tax=Modestobacter sp. VKM Ac-2985 TaxID=3004139 RepID=UPI0022AB9B65|nr:DUF3263 domain-containing protein [Modestobacter sp. VKM Ac-2985]MCZ2837122.1 DUF3263 domain-containing protein [Modestobacter sp. VKM Ac-2985]
MPDLTAEELSVLDFEDQWWRHRGAKDEAIERLFGTTPVRHYQRVTALLDRPEALAARPVVVGRLRRLRERRRRSIGSR